MKEIWKTIANYLRTVKDVSKDIPALKYASVIGIVMSLIVLIKVIDTNLESIFVAFLLLLFVMISTVLFARLVKEKSKTFHLPSKVLIWIVMSMLAFIPGIFMCYLLSGYPASIGKLFFPNTPITVCVRVYDAKKGESTLILRNQGQVVMDYNGEPKLSDIDGQGRACFQNLYRGDKVKLSISFSENYRSVNNDSIYVITGKTIYLPVELPGLDTVRGLVEYNHLPLENVIARVGSLTDTTDKYGYYSIFIPLNVQNKHQEVVLMKEGFMTGYTIATPQLGKLVPYTMEKANKNTSD